MISVIIPCYNAENYIEKSILSSVEQNEVSEIIIVDDGSTDQSLTICNQLSEKYKKVKVLLHADKQNHGRSVSRNLGIKNATNDYVAFLDADDYYLENRFENDIEVLKNDESIDGVYNAISAHFYRKYSEIEYEKLKLTTIREKIPPEELFEKMGPMGHFGYFSGIGLTVRKEVFNRIGFFNEDLEVAEDTELWLKMALKGKLMGGELDTPVAMRGVHEKNISFRDQKKYDSNYKIMFESLLKWSFKNDISLNRIELIWNKCWYYRRITAQSLISNILFWFLKIVNYPKLLILKATYVKFPLFHSIKKLLKK